MERMAIIVGGVALSFGILFSFYNAVTSNPEAFAIIFIIGGLLIGFLFIRGTGMFSHEHPEFPPYRLILGILATCLVLSWVIGSRPTTLSNCPVSVSRWC